MTQNIIEKLREESVKKLFETDGFSSVWAKWKDVIKEKAPVPTVKQIVNLGDNLREIFYSTNDGQGRSQSAVSGGGSNWEALVCWYLNLCLIDSNTVVIKHHKNLIPTPISNGITVNYGNFISNTESDLIAISFPNLENYKNDIFSLEIKDEDGNLVQANKTGSNFLKILNALTAKDFSQIGIHIIQCKTNWNDNAQIPMLWDMIYSSVKFSKNITIGRENFNMQNAKENSYSFVTVPTVNPEKIKETSICVSRVRNLSGGNYWGMETKNGIASSVKEMLNRVFSVDTNKTLNLSINKIIDGTYSYFNFPR